jgi:hypothetical protein
MFLFTPGRVLQRNPQFAGDLRTITAILISFFLNTLVKRANISANILGPINLSFKCITTGTSIIQMRTSITIYSTYTYHLIPSINSFSNYNQTLRFKGNKLYKLFKMIVHLISHLNLIILYSLLFPKVVLNLLPFAKLVETIHLV